MSNWAEETIGPLYAPGGAYKEAVMQDTWGHLAPKKNITYRGTILITKSGYGGSDGKLIDMCWDNLGDSPWLFAFVNTWIRDNREQLKIDGTYKLKTTFRNYRMWGKIIDKITL